MGGAGEAPPFLPQVEPQERAGGLQTPRHLSPASLRGTLSRAGGAPAADSPHRGGPGRRGGGRWRQISGAGPEERMKFEIGPGRPALFRVLV